MLQDAELLMVQHILSSRKVFIGMRDPKKKPSPITLPRFGNGQGEIGAGFVLPPKASMDPIPSRKGSPA